MAPCRRLSPDCTLVGCSSNWFLKDFRKAVNLLFVQHFPCWKSTGNILSMFPSQCQMPHKNLREPEISALFICCCHHLADSSLCYFALWLFLFIGIIVPWSSLLAKCYLHLSGHFQALTFHVGHCLFFLCSLLYSCVCSVCLYNHTGDFFFFFWKKRTTFKSLSPVRYHCWEGVKWGWWWSQRYLFWTSLTFIISRARSLQHQP